MTDVQLAALESKTHPKCIRCPAVATRLSMTACGAPGQPFCDSCFLTDMERLRDYFARSGRWLVCRACGCTRLTPSHTYSVEFEMDS